MVNYNVWVQYNILKINLVKAMKLTLKLIIYQMNKFKKFYKN